MLNDAMFKSVIRSKEARPVVNNFLHFLTHIQMDKLETATYMADLRTVLDKARKIKKKRWKNTRPESNEFHLFLKSRRKYNFFEK